jgi:hypothetical protein
MRIRVNLVFSLTALAFLGGCGGSSGAGDVSANSSPPPAPSKAELIKRGDEICQSGEKKTRSMALPWELKLTARLGPRKKRF